MNQESLSVDYDKIVASELSKIGFPVSKIGNKLKIDWSYE